MTKYNMKNTTNTHNRMYYLIYIFIVLGICEVTTANAQKKHTINNYDNFVGTWEYKTDNEHFILKTKITEYTSPSTNKKRNTLIGVYKYIKDSVVVHDMTSKWDTLSIDTYPKISFLAWEDLPESIPQTKLGIMYNDPTTQCMCKTWSSPLTLISTNPMQLSWHIEPDEWIIEIVEEDDDNSTGTSRNFAELTDIKLNDELLKDDFEKPFTIPTDMILTKVEE